MAAMQIDPYLSSYTKLNFKWINNLNKRTDILNMIEKKVGNNLELTSTGKDFLNPNGTGTKTNNT